MATESSSGIFHGNVLNYLNFPTINICLQIDIIDLWCIIISDDQHNCQARHSEPTFRVADPAIDSTQSFHFMTAENVNAFFFVIFLLLFICAKMYITHIIFYNNLHPEQGSKGYRVIGTAYVDICGRYWLSQGLNRLRS